MLNFLQTIVRTIRGEVSTKKLIKNGLIVGKNFSRQGNVIIDPPHCWLIEIGDDVTLANGVYILAHDASTKRDLNYAKVGIVRIGNNVFVGAKSIILPNVKIGNNVIIGAGSVVTHDIPNDVVVAGNPAQIICQKEEYILKNKDKMKKSHLFEDDYTLRGKINEKQKKHMKKCLEKDIGYVK